MEAAEQLAELIRQKHQVLVQLRDIGRRQEDLISNGDITSVLTLLAAKQQLIAALQGLEQQLEPHYSQDPESRVWASPQHRAACAAQAADCNVLLQEIVHLEKVGAEKMTIRRNDVAEQLQHVHTATHVRSAYEAHRRTQA